MKNIAAIIITFLSFSVFSSQIQKSNYQLNYDSIIFLDAEKLAEQGIKETYLEYKELFSQHIKKLEKITEKTNNNTPSYTVIHNDIKYHIYDDKTQNQSWGRATYAFFKIINNQLKNSKVKLYAISGGNDLGAIFLTQEQYKSAIKSLSKKERPYIPKMEHPWYGQDH